MNSADTTVKVIELVPPAVRTSLLPGQEASESAMPLEEFVSEVARCFRHSLVAFRTTTTTPVRPRLAGGADSSVIMEPAAAGRGRADPHAPALITHRDQLPRLATMHNRWADEIESGERSRACLQDSHDDRPRGNGERGVL